jgi:hypothetical protein
MVFQGGSPSRVADAPAESAAIPGACICRLSVINQIASVAVNRTASLTENGRIRYQKTVPFMKRKAHFAARGHEPALARFAPTFPKLALAFAPAWASRTLTGGDWTARPELNPENRCAKSMTVDAASGSRFFRLKKWRPQPSEIRTTMIPFPLKFHA